MTTGEQRTAAGTEGDEQLRTDLRRARSALIDAEVCAGPAERYVAAHRAALRLAAVVLSVRSRSRPPARSRSRAPRDAWVVLAETAPELAEWAGFFAATQPKREAVENGSRYAVSSREADDLVRDATSFLGVVESLVESVATRGPRVSGSGPVEVDRRQQTR